MAYQTRTKDPLLDRGLQAVLQRRGKEVLGAALLVAAGCLVLMLASYSPDDPNFLDATEVQPRNLMGGIGALVSSLLIMGLGWASWAIAASCLVWGLRLVMHKGAERGLSRAIFVPIWVVVCAIYMSTHVPSDGWVHSFGLGGLFGDAVLGFLLTFLPIGAAFGLKLLALIWFGVAIVLGFFVLGADREELGQLRLFLIGGLGTSFAGLSAVGQSAGKGAARAATLYKERREARVVHRDATGYDDYDQPLNEAAAYDAPPAFAVAPQPAPKKPSILARVPLLARKPEPELEHEYYVPPSHLPEDATAPTDDRVKERIASAISSRVRRGQPVAPPTEVVMPEPEPEPTPAPRAEPLLGGFATRRAPAAPTVRQEPVLTAAPIAEPTPIAPSPMEAAPFATEDAAPFEEVIEDPYDEPAQVIPTPTVVATPQPTRGPGVALNRKVVQHPTTKPAQPSRRAKAEAQPSLALEDTPPPAYEPPALSLLAHAVKIERAQLSDEALEENAKMLESVLEDYGIKGEIVSVRPGPVVTMYELEPAPGLKASRVIGLADDIARSMSALSARVSTVPGRSVIGIELPNDVRETVALREILSGKDFGDNSMKLPLALGKDIGGAPVVANLAKMPHLLIAGTTGSGKSVAINTMILSLLYRLGPDECRMIMIDPKMLELSVYDGIPHLLSPVVTDPKKAVVALKWVVGEMEERYRKMSKMGVRNIDGYNGRVQDALDKGEMFSRTVQTGFDDETGEPVFETEEIKPEKIPYIVVIVDEMADLMMVAGKEIEACIQRLAQMARASGIHLIMATQRPSVDVITGTIKANFPTRISFHVTSKIDSRTILGEMGAEQLLGMGDMLYMAGGSKITRVHGPFCSDEEVEEIVNHLKSFGPPEYASSVLDGPDEEKSSSIDAVLGLGGNTGGEDALYDQAVAIVAKDRKCSTSYIQRKLGIGYNKAARLVEQMEDNHVVSAANHVGKRDILLPEE